MSEHNGNGMNSDNGEDFEDAGLSALYQQTRTEQPSPKSDEALLAMARQQAHKQPHAVSPFSARWPITASMVAVLVIAFGLVMLMKTELGTDRLMKHSASDKLEMKAKNKAEAKHEQLSQQHLSQKLLSQKKKTVSQPSAGKSGSAGMLAAPEQAAKPSQPTEQLQSAPILSAQPMAKKEKPVPVPQRSMNLSDSAISQLQALKKERQVESRAGTVERLKTPQAAIVMKKQSAPAAAVPETKALSGVLPNLASEETMQSLQKSSAACGGKLTKISAQDYWRAYIAGSGHLAQPNVQQNSQAACVAIVVSGKTEYRTITRTALQDRDIKQQVFIGAIKNAVSTLAVTKANEPRDQKQMQLLRKLTNLPYHSVQRWRDWYAENHASLVLSPNGDFIIVQSKRDDGVGSVK